MWSLLNIFVKNKAKKNPIFEVREFIVHLEGAKLCFVRLPLNTLQFFS
jgi:hypothetical protein